MFPARATAQTRPMCFDTSAGPATHSARQRYLLHQVHPLKLTTDIAASVVSDVLFWQHRLVPGVLVLLGPSIVVSSILLRSEVALSCNSTTARYVLRHMPPSMQAVRAASAVVT